MKTIILQLTFTIINVVFLLLMYEEGNYKIATLSAFAGGVCFAGFIKAISYYINIWIEGQETLKSKK